jgi:hypothetical protein
MLRRALRTYHILSLGPTIPTNLWVRSHIMRVGLLLGYLLVRNQLLGCLVYRIVSWPVDQSELQITLITLKHWQDQLPLLTLTRGIHRGLEFGYTCEGLKFCRLGGNFLALMKVDVTSPMQMGLILHTSDLG